jgi:mRNA interferase HicA
VKRQDLIRHLQVNGCHLLREGRAHSIWVNAINGQQAAVPRHREINDYTVRAICRQLGIAQPIAEQAASGLAPGARHQQAGLVERRLQFGRLATPELVALAAGVA